VVYSCVDLIIVDIWNFIAENAATKPFYDIYEHGIMGNEENEFAYMQETQDVVMGNQEAEMHDQDEEPREEINVSELQRLVRERAQQQVCRSLLSFQPFAH
jgi:hypothetical protein